MRDCESDIDFVPQISQRFDEKLRTGCWAGDMCVCVCVCVWVCVLRLLGRVDEGEENIILRKRECVRE